MMKVSLLEDLEKKNIIPLYREVFEDSEAYENYFINNVLPESSVFTCKMNGFFVGMLCFIPKKVCVCGIEICCQYIYGVATKLEWRNKGVMSRIMREAVNHLYLQGTSDYFTYLIPSPASNAAIYEKYGFGTVMDKVCKADKTESVYLEKNIFKRKACRSDIGCLSAFAAKQVGKSFGVYLTKDERYFENMFSLMEAEDGRIDIYTAYETPDGKMDDKTNGRLNGRADKISGYRIGFDDETVEEIYDEDVIGVPDKTSRIEITDILCCDIEHYTLHATKKDPVKNKEYEPKNEITPYIMVRILNISKMIQLMRTVEDGEIILNVIDSVIDENNGTFLWRFGDTCSLERTNSGNMLSDIISKDTVSKSIVSKSIVSKSAICENSEKKKIMTVGIGELASHIFGYKSVAGLPEMCVKKGVFINDYV